MAANILESCVKCNKSSGILLCTGCNRTLCFKHVNEHREEIEKDFEDLINEENQFENDLLNKDDSHYLFNEIDQWKKESIEQIKLIAKQTKEDLRFLINQSSQHLLNDLKFIKENLQFLKESEDLSELQLIKFKNQFNQFKNQVNSFQLIKSSNSNFLKIEKQQQQQQQIDEILSPKPIIPIDKPSINIEEIHSKTEGSILIKSIDPYGYFITIEHTGIKDQDMCGWIIKRSIDSYKDIIYRFPNDFILKSKSLIKILSRQASQTIYSYEKQNILIADSIQTWSTGSNTIVNSLIDPTGDEKHILIQKFVS
jgi:hypothetical protein